MCHSLWLFSLLTLGSETGDPVSWPLGFLEKEAALKTVHFIVSHRVSTGGYSPQAGSSASLRSTFQARKALKTLGANPVQPDLDAAFVRKCVEPETLLFMDRPGEKPSGLISAAGIMASVVVGLHEKPDFKPVLQANARNLQVNAKSFEEIRIGAAAFEALGEDPRVRREWIHQLRKTQSPEGGYGPANTRLKDTGGVVAALLRLGEMIPDREKQVYLEYLLEGQGKGGAFGMTVDSPSDMDSTYRVGRAVWMMGGTPQSQKMTDFLKKCHTTSGGFSDRPGDEPTLPDTYKAVMVASWLKGKR